MIFSILFLASSLSCSSARVFTPEPNASYRFTVLHTNNHQGAILPVGGLGGLCERATFVNAVRRESPNVLVLDAGDVNTGTPLSDMFAAEPDILSYNAIGYDAVAIGTHEFDRGLAVLQRQIAMSEFPWLSANAANRGSYIGVPYIVKDIVVDERRGTGFRVGIAGLTSAHTVAAAALDRGVRINDEIRAARDVVKTLRNKEKADVVIILSSLGDKSEARGQITSIRLAEAVGGIDLIIDGHSRSLYSQPIVTNGTYIVSAGDLGRYMGYGVLTVTNRAVSDFAWQPVPIVAADYPPDATVADIIRPYADRAAALEREPVMFTTARYEAADRVPRYNETAMGNLVSDAAVWYVRDRLGVNVDFAVLNGINIRGGLPAGNVTRADIRAALPRNNTNYVVTLTGRDVIDLFDFVATVNQGAGGFPQISSDVRYILTLDEYQIASISTLTVNGKPVERNRIYRVVTDAYLADGGDGYEVMRRSTDTFDTAMTLRDIVTGYVQTLVQPVQPKIDGRVTLRGPGVIAP